MRNKLLNAKEISNWADKRMTAINRYIRNWAQNSPLPSGNVKLPNEFLSNDPKTLQQGAKLYSSDRGFRHNPQGNEAYLDLKGQLAEKQELAQIKGVAKHNPDMASFEQDLKAGGGTTPNFLHMYGAYNVTDDNYSADLVHKDAQKIGRLSLDNYGSFLESHPKFATALNIVPASVLREYNHANGFESRNKGVNNMATYYDSKALKGEPYIEVSPLEVQMRARYYGQHMQIKRGERIPFALKQGFALSEVSPSRDMRKYLQNKPELSNKLNVSTEDLSGITDRRNGNKITTSQLLERNRRFMARSLSHILNRVDEHDKHISNDVVKQAQDIAKKAGINAVQNAQHQSAETHGFNDRVATHTDKVVNQNEQNTIKGGNKVDNPKTKFKENTQVAKHDNIGKYFEEHPKEADKFGVRSGKQMATRLNKMVEKSEDLSNYLKSHTHSTKMVNDLVSANRRLEYILTTLDPNKAYRDEIVDMPSNKVKPVTSKTLNTMYQKETAKKRANAKPKLHRFHLYNNNFGKFFDQHPTLGKRIGVMSGTQAWTFLKSQSPYKPSDYLDSSKAYASTEVIHGTSKNPINIDYLQSMNGTDVVNFAKASKMADNPKLNDMLKQHGVYGLDKHFMNSKDIQEQGKINGDKDVEKLGAQNATAKPVYNDIKGFPVLHQDDPGRLTIPAEAVKDGYLKDTMKGMSDHDKKVLFADPKEKATYNEKHRIDESVLMRTFHHEDNRNYVAQMGKIDEKRSSDPNFTINDKLRNVSSKERNVINGYDYYDLKAFKADIDGDLQTRNEWSRKGKVSVGDSITKDNMAQMPEGQFLNEHPNLKTRLYLKTKPDGNIYVKNDKALTGGAPFTLNNLSNRVNGKFNIMTQERKLPHGLWQAGSKEKDFKALSHLDKLAQNTPEDSKFLNHMNKVDRSHSHDGGYNLNTKMSKLNDREKALVNDRDLKGLRGLRGTALDNIKAKAPAEKQGQSVAKYLKANPSIETRLNVTTDGKSKVFAKSNDMKNAKPLSTKDLFKNVDASYKSLYKSEHEKNVIAHRYGKLDKFVQQNSKAIDHADRAMKLDNLVSDAKEMNQQPGTKKYHLHNLDQYRNIKHESQVIKQMGKVLKGNGKVSRDAKNRLATHANMFKKGLSNSSRQATKNLFKSQNSRHDKAVKTHQTQNRRGGKSWAD